jgi:hypothetical protein
MVSIVMSVYNGQAYLNLAIESILNQTFGDFELILINDASTDSTRDIILSYKDKRIVLIENETNIGLTKSLNKGIEVANGKFIARMDADDIMHPQRFQEQNNFLKNNQQVAVVGSSTIKIDEQGNEIGKWNVATDPAEIKTNLFFGNVMPHSSVFIRAEIIKQKPYNPEFKYSQDFELWNRLSVKHVLANIEEPLVCNRILASSISSAQQQEQEAYAIKVHQSQLKQLGITALNKEMLQFHYSIIRNRLQNPSKEETIKVLGWLKKLDKANQHKKVYPPILFQNRLKQIWQQHFSLECGHRIGFKAIPYALSSWNTNTHARARASFILKCL